MTKVTTQLTTLYHIYHLYWRQYMHVIMVITLELKDINYNMTVWYMRVEVATEVGLEVGCNLITMNDMDRR